MTLELSADDRALLDGARGEGAALAMRILVEVGTIAGADRLIGVAGAHVDSCLYHGPAGLDFAQRLRRGGARVAVPTTLNVSSLDLLHPGLVRLDPGTATQARRLMDAYVAMGCRPTWTCAPYQLEDRPAFGEHVAWAESNAIVFANAVLGARTDRYGDFIDICAAVVGRVPLAGLHTDEGRRARAVFRLEAIPDRILRDETTPTLVGHVVGRRTGSLVPAIVGLPPADEDRLKALGAAAASSGAVAMFHAVGITPEAPTLETATGGVEPDLEATLGPEDLAEARRELTTVAEGPLGAISLGTPHCSLAEVERIAALVAEAPPVVPAYVNLGRDTLAEAARRGLDVRLAEAGVTLVSDTCTYITPILHDLAGPVMTDSAKWAWYAPGNLGFDVVFGSTLECVRSAALGHVWHDPEAWGDDG
jgi:predicted aconitase